MGTTIIFVALWFLVVPFLLGAMFSLGWHMSKCLFRDTTHTTTTIRVEPREEKAHEID